MIKFSEIIEQFESSNYWGLCTSIDIYNCDANKIRDVEYIKKYIDELCKIIKMNKYGDPLIANFGIDERVNGISFMQMIETSSITGHFSNMTNAAYIDIFSCKLYDPNVAMEYTADYFDGENIIIGYSYRK